MNEVLSPDPLLGQAWNLARKQAQQPTLNLRYTHAALAQRLKRLVSEGIGYGLALEGITATDLRNT